MAEGGHWDTNLTQPGPATPGKAARCAEPSRADRDPCEATCHAGHGGVSTAGCGPGGQLALGFGTATREWDAGGAVFPLNLPGY